MATSTWRVADPCAVLDPLRPGVGGRGPSRAARSGPDSTTSTCTSSGRSTTVVVRRRAPVVGVALVAVVDQAAEAGLTVDRERAGRARRPRSAPVRCRARRLGDDRGDAGRRRAARPRRPRRAAPAEAGDLVHAGDDPRAQVGGARRAGAGASGSAAARSVTVERASSDHGLSGAQRIADEEELERAVVVAARRGRRSRPRPSRACRACAATSWARVRPSSTRSPANSRTSCVPGIEALAGHGDLDQTAAGAGGRVDGHRAGRRRHGGRGRPRPGR